MKLRHKLLFGFAFTTWMASGQKLETVESPIYNHPIMQHEAIQWHAHHQIQFDAETEIRQLIFQRFPSIEGSGIVLDGFQNSPSGKHYHFYQTISGVRVYGSGITANVNSNGKIDLITAHVFPTNLASTDEVIESPTALNSSDFQNAPSQPIWFYNGSTLDYLTRNVIIDGYVYEEVIVNDQAQVIWQRDLNLHVDTTLTVYIFNPDPLTTAHSLYTYPYLDSADRNQFTLDPLRVVKTVNGSYTNGKFRLQNPWVKIQDFDSPSTAIAQESSSTFNYSRNDDRFEQVNAFYHLTTYQEYMQNLGFTLVNYQIPVDPNSMSGSDNSMFSTSTNPPRLYFGEGGVDDAEDADVIVHEYGHAISYSAAPNTNGGTERGCLDEALGDYLAASYSRSIDSYGYDRIFSWDGHNEYWPGRSGSSFKKYQNLTFTGIYQHTDIWVASCMRIMDAIGRPTTDKLVLESIYGWAPNMTMPQAAMLIVQADSSQNGGQNIQPIWEAFVHYGILNPAPWSVEENKKAEVQFLNTIEFSKTGSLQVKLNSTNRYTYSLSDLTGRIVDHGNVAPGTSLWDYHTSIDQSGMYILSLTNEQNKTASEKLTLVR